MPHFNSRPPQLNSLTSDTQSTEPQPAVPENSTKRKVKQKLQFEALGLSERRLKILDSVGYEKPTPIQAGLIPLVLDGMDLIGQARTGTGKTAARRPVLPKGARDIPRRLYWCPPVNYACR